MRRSALGVGLVFGFLLTASGLGDYDTVHDGLPLQDPYVFLMTASAMATAFVGLAVLRRTGRTRYAGRLSLPHHQSSGGTSTAARSSDSASGSARPAPA